MTAQDVIDLIQQAFRVSLLLSAPMLLAALFIGIAVSVFQSVTSIQEQTLVFVPKMLGVLAAMIVFFSFLLRTLMNFTTYVLEMIPKLAM